MSQRLMDAELRRLVRERVGIPKAPAGRRPSSCSRPMQNARSGLRTVRC